MNFKNRGKNPPNQSGNNLLIWVILLLGLAVRLYQINTPLADWHSWRQADTASVAVEFIKHGIDFLHPKYLDLSNIPSGMENPEGYRMVEFPLISADVAWTYTWLPSGTMPLHVFYRLESIFYSLFSLFLLYKLVRLFETENISLLTALVFAILPYNVFYSRTVLPEIPLVTFSLLALYSLVRYFKSRHTLKNPWFWLAALAGALALLLKPTAIFFALPALYVGFSQCRSKLLTDYKTYLFLFLTLTPLFWWRFWIGHYPAGIPAFTWLLNSNGIRFKGAFFHWLFAERLGKLILGYWGLIFLGFGLVKKTTHHFFTWWLVSCVLYLFIFATGNVQHDYYQIILIPIICVYVAKGIAFLLEQKNLVTNILLLVTCAFMLAFGWFEVRGYYQINNPAMVEAGRAVDQLTEPDALVIAPYGGDTAFLYQTNRRGWPIGGQIEKRIEQGADYYVTTTLDDEAKELSAKFQVVETNNQFTLIQLRPQL